MKLPDFSPFHGPQIPGRLVFNNLQWVPDFLLKVQKDSFAECPVYKGISILFGTRIKIPSMGELRSLDLTLWVCPSLFFCSCLCPIQPLWWLHGDVASRMSLLTSSLTTDASFLDPAPKHMRWHRISRQTLQKPRRHERKKKINMEKIQNKNSFHFHSLFNPLFIQQAFIENLLTSRSSRYCGEQYRSSCLHGTSGLTVVWVYTAEVCGSLIMLCFQGSKFLSTSKKNKQINKCSGKMLFRAWESNLKLSTASDSNFPLWFFHLVLITFHCELQSCQMLALYPSSGRKDCYTCQLQIWNFIINSADT